MGLLEVEEEKRHIMRRGKGVVGPSSTDAATQQRTETARRGELDRGKAVRTE